MNREITSNIYPLAGDVTSTAGVPTVTVVGIQNVPVDPTSPTQGQVLAFEDAVNQYVPTSIPATRCIQVNGIAVSDDYDIFVNATQIEVNGVPV